MKRMLAMLMTVFFSIQNNVGVQFSADNAFMVDSWYTIQEDTAPDYRQLYTGGVQLTSADNCTPSTRTVQDAVQIESETTTGMSAYWFAESLDTMSVTDVPDETEFVWETSGEIVAPLNCVVSTSATSGGGHSMRIDTVAGDYTFVFEDMERWYCCRYRKGSGTDEEGTPVPWSHTVDIAGRTIKAGQLVGFAKEGTTVKVYDTRSGNLISIKSFYNR